MATFYLDFENGNDAADGTTFANRWKTMTTGASAARIAPGDTIRIMASRDNVSLGSCTWTDNSKTVTLPSAKTKTLFLGNGSWTGYDSNVTQTDDNSVTYAKTGTRRYYLNVQSAFTTGKIAYYTFPSTLDLSAYQQISLWWYADATSSKGSEIFQLKLCSDSTGDTAVDTFSIAARASAWQNLVIDKGSALGSSINSMSLWATSDPGSANNLHVTALIACKAPSSSDCLTLQSLIGKNTAGEPEWYPILYIDDTSVVLGGHKDIYNNTTKAYRGATETVTTYAVNPIPLWSDIQYVQDNGSAAGIITFSGGWNRTNMSTQTGVTWLSAQNYWNNWMIYTTVSGFTIDKVGLAHGSAGGVLLGYNVWWNPTWPIRFTNSPGIVGCLGNALQCGGPNYTSVEVDVDCIVGNAVAVVATVWSQATTSIDFGAITNNYTNQQALLANGFGTIRFKGVAIKNNTSYGFSHEGNNYSTDVTIKGATFSYNGGADINLVAQVNPNKIKLIDCTLNSSTAVYIAGGYHSNSVWCQNYGGTIDDHRFFYRYFTGGSETSVRHTSSGIAWKLNPTDATNCHYGLPAILPLGQFAFNSGTLVTVKCWCRRTNTGITVGIKIPGWQINGIPDDLTTTMTAAADTWEELTITFTPTQTGALELIGYAYGGSSYTAYFDDVTITQA